MLADLLMLSFDVPEASSNRGRSDAPSRWGLIHTGFKVPPSMILKLNATAVEDIRKLGMLHAAVCDL